jgi:uncharacterized SAM-binding protein YcdF (DUF218 family)
MKPSELNCKDVNRKRVDGKQVNYRQRGGIIFRLLGLLFILLLLAGVYFVRHPLLRTAARLWIVSDPISRAEAMLVLGDDNFSGDRASRAAELYHGGMAPLVVASGRRLRPYSGIAELIEKDLENRGVPPAQIVRLTHDAKNTQEEAIALRRIALQRNWQQVLVVTSNYHTRRARYIMRKTFPATISVEVAPARDSDFNPDSWWTTRKGQELFFMK